MYIFDFIKRLFRKNNIGVIVYLILNVCVYIWLFGGFTDGNTAAFAVGLYFVTLCVALSPVGEYIMRLQNGCHKITRKDYLDRLTPLFEEVYAQAKAKDPSISNHVQLFISGSKSPNAFATGRKTICLTQGFMSCSDAQIKGTLAHEFGHLANKDTDLLLLISVGNLLISAIFIVWRIVFSFLAIVFSSALDMDWLGTLLSTLFINLLLTLCMWVWTKIGMFLVMYSSRQNEYKADKFAYDLGYGNELSAVLYSFDEDSDEAESHSLWSHLHRSHPATDDRILRLRDLDTAHANPKAQRRQAPPKPAKAASVPMGAAALVPLASARAAATACTQCGEAMEHGDRFCTECGTRRQMYK